MGRVARWVLAIGAVVGLAILYLHRTMKADSAVAKEEKLLRRVAAGSVTDAINKVEAEIKATSARAEVAEAAAAEASDRFEAALQRARSLWFQTTGGG